MMHRAHLGGLEARLRSLWAHLPSPATTLVWLAIFGVLLLLAIACSPAAQPPGNGPAPGAPATGAPAPGPPAAQAPVTQPATYIPDRERPGIGGCSVYPRGNVFHSDVAKLPVHPDSTRMINAVGPQRILGPGFYSTIWEGSRGGIPINVVDSGLLEPTDVIGGTYGYMSDLQDHPIPPNPKIEGHPGVAWDRHMILLDVATCVSSEFFYVYPPNLLFDRWVATTAVKLDLRSNTPRELGSATASGMSMLATMIRYDEVASGEIHHMLEVMLPVIAQGAPTWPATRTDGTSSHPNAPPMGTIFRLRADVDISGMPPQARTIATALKTHGAVLGDTGPGFGMRGENDPRWDDADLKALNRLTLSDFEVVDPEPMKVSEGSYAIR